MLHVQHTSCYFRAHLFISLKLQHIMNLRQTCMVKAIVLVIVISCHIMFYRKLFSDTSKKEKIIKMFNLMLNHTSVDLNCNGYVPQTEKNISFEARYRAKNCLIFFHTEVFKAYILYLKHCHCISLLIYLRQFDFEVYHYCNHWWRSDIKKHTNIGLSQATF